MTTAKTFPIPGKLKAEDLGQLLELVTDKNVLQLGCHCGRGLVAIARHAKEVWVLEDFTYTFGLDGIGQELMANVERYAPPEKEIHLLQGTPLAWVVYDESHDLRRDLIDVVYRDADRKEDTRNLDERLAYGVLRRYGGIYAWHDKERDLKWLRVEPVNVEVN